MQDKFVTEHYCNNNSVRGSTTYSVERLFYAIAQFIHNIWRIFYTRAPHGRRHGRATGGLLDVTVNVVFDVTVNVVFWADV